MKVGKDGGLCSLTDIQEHLKQEYTVLREFLGEICSRSKVSINSIIWESLGNYRGVGIYKRPSITVDGEFDLVIRDFKKNNPFPKPLSVGDTMVCQGQRAVIQEILTQDHCNEVDRSYVDIEFKDGNGRYRHWKSYCDGGSVIYKD